MFFCLLCHGHCSPLKDVCDGCYDDLPWNHTHCIRCSEPVIEPMPSGLNEDGICQRCQQQEPYFDRCIAPFRYEFPIDQLLLQGKGGAQAELLKPLSRWLAEQVRRQMGFTPDLLAPVPMTPQKQRQRGYNQAGLVATQIGAALSLPVSHELIKKVREPAQQKSLSRSAREQNLRRAFRIDRTVLRGFKKPVRHVVLIDDVVTTGSTINQLSQQLRSSGVEQVEAWAIAYTARKR